MGVMKTPGVYIVEKNAFPNSVVEVATAVPAFIGYTERADNKGKTLRNKPWRITSMAEFRSYFGEAPKPLFTIKEKDKDSTDESAFTLDKKEYLLEQDGKQYILYSSMLSFFQNGGGPCYIVSVGSYGDDIAAPGLMAGIEELKKEQEPTMVVIPEAVKLALDDCIAVQQAALGHCGITMRNRFAVLDVHNGFKESKGKDGCVEVFRNKLGTNNLDYGAAYYPWINTSVVQDSELSYENMKDVAAFKTLLETDVDTNPLIPDAKKGELKEIIAAIAVKPKDGDAVVATDADAAATPAALAPGEIKKILSAMSPLYGKMIAEIKSQLNLLPPSAAMAGIYTMVDNGRGVWKAPANVSLNGVISPAVNISHEQQEDLNVTTQGKSINAIRTFIGEGTLVWGARTLDGNSLDWRYINVRRTMIMLEESIKLASKAYVFEPNNANTWVTIKSMIRNFLTGIWKRGGLAGASPDDAFSVHVGLGETMTSEDILEGILNVTVLVAISRPAEFIEITFQQQMQKS